MAGVGESPATMSIVTPRVSNVHNRASLGTTAQGAVQMWAQGTGMARLGYGAAGIVSSNPGLNGLYYGRSPKRSWRCVSSSASAPVRYDGARLLHPAVWALATPRTEKIRAYTHPSSDAFTDTTHLGVKYLLRPEVRVCVSGRASRHQEVGTMSSLQLSRRNHCGAVEWGRGNKSAKLG